VLAKKSQRLVARGGALQLVAERFEDSFQREEVLRAVIGQEDGCSGR
jgi:hypothetical protein